MNKIDNETLDVRSICILIGHDHQVSVTKRLDARLIVLGAVLETHNVNQILDFFIIDHGLVCSVANVQRLSLQREDPVVVTADNREAGHGEGLGRVPLGNDQRAIVGLGGSSQISVIKLDNPGQLALLGTTATLERQVLLVFSVGQDGINNIALFNLLVELSRNEALGSKVLGPRGQEILGLAIESRVLDQTIDKDGEMVLDLVGLHLGTSLVLLLDDCNQVLCYLVGNVRDMTTTFAGTNAIDKGDLLHACVLGGRDTNLPAISKLGVGDRLVDAVKHAEVVLEGLDGQLFTVQADGKPLATTG